MPSFADGFFEACFSCFSKVARVRLAERLVFGKICESPLPQTVQPGYCAQQRETDRTRIIQVFWDCKVVRGLVSRFAWMTVRSIQGRTTLVWVFAESGWAEPKRGLNVYRKMRFLIWWQDQGKKVNTQVCVHTQDKVYSITHCKVMWWSSNRKFDSRTSQRQRTSNHNDT